jgi:hypothetical protein
LAARLLQVWLLHVDHAPTTFIDSVEINGGLAAAISASQDRVGDQATTEKFTTFEELLLNAMALLPEVEDGFSDSAGLISVHAGWVPNLLVYV